LNFGGGALNRGRLVISNSRLTENRANYGGAIVSIFVSSTLTVTDSILISNSAVESGGGVYAAETTATLLRVTVHQNQAAIRDGGGIANADSALTIANSTFSGNVAEGTGASASGLGGAIANTSRGLPSTVRILNTTIATNTAISGGAIANEGVGGSPRVTFRNMLLADNQASAGPDGCVNQNGTLQSLGANLEDGDTCELNLADDLPNTVALIGPLADNGGPTPTHALLNGSPAIDGGNGATCTAAPISGIDQRGIARTTTICDIGAFEFTRELFFPHILRTRPVAQ
jgi:hypothetical protein